MDSSNRLLGFYRAKVVNNRDETHQGRVIVWIPAIMPDVDDKSGLWARPANNPVGGRNMEESEDHHYMGTCYIPRNGSWLFVFFEAGNIDNPYYFGGLDIGNTKTLPECQDAEYWHKWVVFKSPEGRCVVISDDPNDARVEITGKKRQISDPPTGDIPSVYNIDGNQTTILLDEVADREKLLIKTYLGDFIHIDIDQRKLQCSFESDILIKSGGNIHVEAEGNIEVKSGIDTKVYAVQTMHLKSGIGLKQTAGADHHTLAGGNIYRDGSTISDNGGHATQCSEAKPEVPEGERTK